MSALAKIYGKAVLDGRKTMDEVPEKLVDEVKEYILSVDPHFFDDPEPVEPEVPAEPESDLVNKEAVAGGSGVGEEVENAPVDENEPVEDIPTEEAPTEEPKEVEEEIAE